MAEHILADHYKGDTFDGEQFTILINNSPSDLTDAHIKMDVRKIKTGTAVLRLSTDAGGISITEPASGIFQIDPQIIDIPAAKYFYDIQITYPTGLVKTYIEGTWTILQDVTYG